MKILILYYSRTGTTEKVAKGLANDLNAEIEQIQCGKYQGWFRYFLAGYDSVKGRLPEIDVPDIDFRDFDLLVLGSPIWTSYPALPMRSFLSRERELPDRIAFFMTFGGHSPPEEAEQVMTDLLPVKPVAALHISQKDNPDGVSAESIATFVQELKDSLASNA